MTRRCRALVLPAALVAAALMLRPVQADDFTFYWSRYWLTPHTQADFPESKYLPAGTSNLGISFSGGGTRSASATIGEIRGLIDNGWFHKVRYVAAVSGGSWAALPYTYADYDDATLLGKSYTPFELGRKWLETRPPDNSLMLAVTKSRVLAPGGIEAAKIIAGQSPALTDLPSQLRGLTARFLGSRDETYANILARAFISPLIPQGAKQRYGWTVDSVLKEFTEYEGQLTPRHLVTVVRPRPYLIVGGTIIYTHQGDYPSLLPVEYTPIYTGVRHRFSRGLGGVYVSSYAYDVARTGVADANLVLVGVREKGPVLTLADVIASSGAAPLLTLFLKDTTGQSTLQFPTFNHYSVRRSDGPAPADPIAQISPITERLLHGDGGFTDYLGLMPLLARQVTNVIVFLNGTGPVKHEDAITSLFYPLTEQSGSADRTGNVVFEKRRHEELLHGLKANVDKGLAAIYCTPKGDPWKVLDNELYEIKGYDGLNICFVATERNERWTKALPTDTQALLTTKGFRGFPWFSTFGQNIPYVIRLKPAQVNLLGQFTSWMLNDPDNRAVFEQAGIADALK
jgi:hypothetical protein